eukprot:281441_1
MNTKSYIIAVALIMALINLSYGSLLRRLSASSNTVTITFNNMICVEFYGTVWTYLQAYSGDYIFNGIINEAPSYIMMTCQDPSYCKKGMTLSIGTDGKWYFNGQPSGNTTPGDPFCQIATRSPAEIQYAWWPENPASITNCGVDFPIPYVRIDHG